MKMRQILSVLVFAIAASSARAQMTVTQSNTAPTDNVVISQAVASHNVQFAWGQALGTDNMPRDAGQSFPGGFVLDKITVRLDTVSANVYDGHGVDVLIFKLDNASDFTAGTIVANESGIFPANMKNAFDSGNEYLAFDISNIDLDAGQQYGFRLQIASQAGTAAEHMKLHALANTIGNYADGIGLYRTRQSTESQMTVWTGAQTPADLVFYLQEFKPAGTMIVIQ